MAEFKDAILSAIAVDRWTQHRDVLARFASAQATAAMLGQLVKQREIWCSYEATMDGDRLQMVARYCLAHDVGDPPIGRRVRPAMMEMAE